MDFPGGRAKNAPIVFCSMLVLAGDAEGVRGLFLGWEVDAEAEAAEGADVDTDADADPDAFLSKCAETATSTTALTFSSSVDHLVDPPAADVDGDRPSLLPPSPSVSRESFTNCEATPGLTPRRSTTWAATVDAKDMALGGLHVHVVGVTTYIM